MSVDVTPWPTGRVLRDHLETVHGMPAAVIATHEPKEHRQWHEAEHRYRKLPDKEQDQHSGHLRHEHIERRSTGSKKRVGRTSAVGLAGLTKPERSAGSSTSRTA